MMASAQRLQVVLNHLQSPVHPSVQRTAASQYVYTLDTNLLTAKQRAFYELNGFIIIPKLIEDELLDECRQRFVDICNGVVDKGGMTMMKDISLMKTNAQGEFLYNKIQDIVWDDVFSKYFLHPKLIQYVECFTGPDISVMHSMLVNKPPDSGKLTSIHPLHQDLYYIPFRPVDKIVTSWTAMEKVTVQNGCLYVISGTHKGALQPHDYPLNNVNKAYHGVIGDFHLFPKVNLEMEKGDTVFIHPLTMHGSGPNLTKGFRKAISSFYASNNCYFIDLKGTTQENIVKEIEENEKRHGIEMTLQERYILRQRLIKGKRGSLNSTKMEEKIMVCLL